MADDAKIDEAKLETVAARAHVENESEEYWSYHCPHCARAGITRNLAESARCDWCREQFNVTAEAPA